MNKPQVQAQRPKFSAMISTPGYQKMINNTLQDPKRAQRFIASITSAVATNPALQECDPPTILSGALLGESLGLSPSPQLGQYYLVPYWNKKKGCNDAQFQLGYKGYVQLALRSGYYKRLNVIAVKAGELVRYDPLTEDVELVMNQDELDREKAATIGYLAMFEYLNGFRKTLYWSKEKMIAHADRFSPAFSASAQVIKGKNGSTYHKVSFADYEAGNYPKQDEWLYSSFWYKDFDAMAYKTMLRQLISKWGIMSIELQTAFEQDFVQPSEDYVEAAEIALPDPQEGAVEEPAPDNLEAVTLDDL
ncbi:recombinase RecT [uncultured Intestinimonas sp.]|uniref:recombinase RecT n=1 Tax=uncultured Intestinimonas sp. TaxID=1689265 RepID=UPI002943EF81|nr:recombinase RecT [uncultured Intestinimonas sp.]